MAKVLALEAFPRRSSKDKFFRRGSTSSLTSPAPRPSTFARTDIRECAENKLAAIHVFISIPLHTRMPAVEKDIARIMEKKLSLAAFLPNSKELIGVVVLCPKESPLEQLFGCVKQGKAPI